MPLREALTVAQALERPERDLLVTLRAKVADEIDAGVQPAYLDRLIRQLRDLDRAIRDMDAAAEAEEERKRGTDGGRKPFDATAI